MAARGEAGFLKRVATQDCLEKIRISPGYVNYIRGNLPSMVIFKDIYGNQWQVQVEKHENEFWFVEGWKQFLEDNHVEIGNLVIFDYDGPNVFTVTLYGNDMCTALGVGGLKTELVDGEEHSVVLDGEEEDKADEVESD